VKGLRLLRPHEPRPLPVPSGEPILAQHQANLAGLRAELEEVVKLREKSSGLLTDLAIASTILDGMADDLLDGRGSDEDLGKAKLRKSSLEAQAARLHERRHAAELSLQRRLTLDITAILRLEGAWTAFELNRETEKLLALFVPDRRESLWEDLARHAHLTISYQSTVASLGEYLQSAGVWSVCALDAPPSQKTEHSTKTIPDPIYKPPTREEVIGHLLVASDKASRRWEVLLGLVASAVESGFQLPSYEEPLPQSEAPPVEPDTGKSVHAFWTPQDLETPHHWMPPTFTKPGSTA
jgi:hypothetical protein